MFVRQDLTLAQQIVQTNHATFDMAYTLTQSVDLITPSIVLVGVPSQKALQRVIDKLKAHRIEFSVFDEPDNDLGLTAVATVPLDDDQKQVLQNYRLWNESNNVSPLPTSSVVRASSSQDEEGRWFESGVGSQTGEQLGCVAGSNPVSPANFMDVES